MIIRELNRLRVEQSSSYIPLDPPLLANPNPELIDMAAAYAFPNNEADTILNAYPENDNGAVIINSVSDQSNNYGYFVTDVENTDAAPNQERMYLRFSSGEFQVNKTYEFAFLYRMRQGINGQVRIQTLIDSVTNTPFQEIDLSNTNWVLSTGEFSTTGTTLTRVDFIAYAAYDFANGALGDAIQFKVSCKEKLIAASSGLYTSSNAASIDSEANTTTDWSVGTNCRVVSEADPRTGASGSYSIGVSTASNGEAYTEYILDTGFSGSTTYDVTFWAKNVAGANAKVSVYNGGTELGTVACNDTAWTEKTFSFTTPAFWPPQSLVLRIYSSATNPGGNERGQELRVDDINITAQ